MIFNAVVKKDKGSSDALGVEELNFFTNLIHLSSTFEYKNNIGSEFTRGFGEGLKYLTNLTNLTLTLGAPNNICSEEAQEELKQLINFTDLSFTLQNID